MPIIFGQYHAPHSKEYYESGAFLHDNSGDPDVIDQVPQDLPDHWFYRHDWDAIGGKIALVIGLVGAILNWDNSAAWAIFGLVGGLIGFLGHLGLFPLFTLPVFMVYVGHRFTLFISRPILRLFKWLKTR